MFFKNIFVFAFTRTFTTTDLELHEALGNNEFTPLGSTELRHYGWVRPLDKSGNFTNMSGDNTLICARSEEKILPSPVIKDMVDAKIEEFELALSQTPSKKEREQIKEDVIFELLPRAFNRVTDTHAYINTKENIIVINTSSRSKAEDLLALLRKTLGTLPVTSPSPDKDVSGVMTVWASGENDVNGDEFTIGKKFSFGYEAELQSLGDQAPIVKVKDFNIECEHITALINDDMFITKLALEYDDTMSFMLSDDLSIKRIKFFDVIVEQNDDIDCDDVQAKLMADFALMAGELNRMINDLFAEFGDSARNYLEQ